MLEKKGPTRDAARRACKLLIQEAAAFEQDEAPLMMLVCEPGMKPRHWEEIKRTTRLEFEVTPATNVLQLMDVGLNHYVHLIEDTCVAASKEAAPDKALCKMEDAWAGASFATKEWRTGRILAGIDEIQQELDDQIVKTQAMHGSRYVKPFLGRVEAWEHTLTSLQDIIDNWLKVQAAWLYLEPIFSSDDITRQMPTEAAMFTTVNQVWIESMNQTNAEPAVLSVARRPGLLEALTDANDKLEVIQKGLNDYLETKRLAFPRFFFLSNDELLEILAETKDPTRVQPHLKKCFDGVANLDFDPELNILAALDARGIPHGVVFAALAPSKRVLPSGGRMVPEAVIGDAVVPDSDAILRTFDDKYFRRADSPRTSRGAAAAATWIFRGRLRCRYSLEASRGRA